jgi:hypothetical protein
MAGRNPRYNGRVGLYPTYRIEKMTGICDNMATLSVATPSIWYKAGPTASTNTNNYNTVTAGNFEWMYDFSGSGRNLTPEFSYAKFKYQPPSYEKNGFYYFGVIDEDVAYMKYNGSIPADAGKGTFICVYRNGGTGSLILNLSARPTQPVFNAITSGYMCETGRTTIFGDNQAYSFSNGSNNSEWNIRVVSVSSAGNPIVYKNNGVQGSTMSYSGTIMSSGTNEVGMRTFAGVSVAEYMWWRTPLNSTDCTSVETYLKQKWCIDY